ncbi:MAG TPA: hypothetical protein DEF79_03240 [Gammaproteobacteria bacterium]|nr:hypothetical protein [Gammaproteobacteria bacterium]|tara:strand:- start:2696 stop:3424 length:729 start_codon:yes stop_codon:yes gene_type:complete
MLPESELVPYGSSGLPTGPWLVFAPHPDDETFGLGGSLVLASQQNLETHVVFVTDGALGGKTDQASLVSRRKAEAEKASAALGVSQTYFFGEPDRGLAVCNRLINKVSELICAVRPSSIFIPTPLEYHPDHRATSEIVWQAVQAMADFQGDVYGYEVSNLAPINLLIDTSAVAEQKYKVIKIYASQLTENKYMALVKAIDTARTFSLPFECKAAEGFFRFSDTSRTLEDQVLESLRLFFRDV